MTQAMDGTAAKASSADADMMFPRDLSTWTEPREGTQARQVFDLYRAGYSPRRIASILDKTIGCVRVTLHYARCHVSRKHRT